VTSATARLNQLFRGMGVPLSATLEIADRCNEVCVHCYQVQGLKGEMSTADLLRVVDELAEAGVLQLVISGGEPTLRADFLDVVRRARAHGMLVVVFTNGLRITPVLARELAALHVMQMEISLYSHRAEIHDGVTGVPGSFQKTTDAIRMLRAEGVHVVVKTPAASFNERELLQWEACVRALGAHPQMGPERMHVREGGGVEPVRFDRSAETALALLRRHGGTEALPSRADKLGRAPCGACRTPHIEAHGEIRPCSQLEVPVGDAARPGGVGEWLRGGPTRRLLEASRWQDLHGCRDCDLVPYCERCYAAALHQGGDAFGPYGAACEAARLRYEAAHGVAPEVDHGSGPARPTGPYRGLGPHRFALAPHQLLPGDVERRARHPWTVQQGFVPVERLRMGQNPTVQPLNSGPAVSH
jgi:radical SAM protein with 4Fe4S-binding SPASM domain